MNKLKIWLIPIGIVLLSLVGLVYFKGKIENNIPKNTESRLIENKNEEIPKKPKGFASPSEKINEQKKAEEDASAMANALENNDLTSCQKITWNEEMRIQCEDNLNYAKAIQSSDISLCKKLHSKDLKAQCLDRVYMSLAIDQKDQKICKKIEDKALKNNCLDQIFMTLARNATNISQCSKITSTQLKKQCEDNFYLKNGIKALNMDECDKISNSKTREKCKKSIQKNIVVKEESKKAAENAKISRSSEEILEICDTLTGKKAIICKNSVYPQLAFDKKDLSYCDKISDETEIAECKKTQGRRINSYYLRQSLASKDKTVCDKILDEDLKKVCKSS